MTDQPKTRRVQVAAHERDMPLKTYDLQCAWCGRQAMVTTYPGRPPRFCSADCATEVLLAMTQVNKTAALAVLDDLAAALVVWRPALVRRALLEELARSSGPPMETHLMATLELALATVRDPAWPTAIAQLRDLVEREGRIRRQGDQVQLRKLVTTVADELSRAQGGSEQAFAQVLTRPQLWALAAT